MMVVSKTVINEKSIQSVRDARKKGESQYKDFVNERIIKTEKSIHDVIKRNKLPLFRQKNSDVTSNSTLQVTSFKQDCSLYASLYVACQTRECDLDEFFSHENHSYPPSLSQYGRVRQTAKSDCIKIFSKYAEVRYQEPDITALVIDGAALVQMLPPRKSTTFGDYCRHEFFSKLHSKIKQSSLERIDVVFNVYREKSIKALTRGKRGTGARKRVTDKTPITRKWQNFLRVNENKLELFRHIAGICSAETALYNLQLVFANDDDATINCKDVNKEQLSPCNHEEADAIKTVDTDVVIIAIVLFRQLSLVHLWIEFGTGKDRRWLPIHDYANALEERVCSGLLFWYAFTGCDTASSVCGRGKLSAWDVWKAFPEVTETFIFLFQMLLIQLPMNICRCFRVTWFCCTIGLLSVFQ